MAAVGLDVRMRGRHKPRAFRIGNGDGRRQDGNDGSKGEFIQCDG